MDPTVTINEPIDVVCVFRARGDIATLCLPVRMRWRGRDIELSELGLRHPTVQGHRMIHVFHMSDGVNGYRIEFDAEALNWTLVSTIGGFETAPGGDSGYFNDGVDGATVFEAYHDPDHDIRYEEEVV